MILDQAIAHQKTIICQSYISGKRCSNYNFTTYWLNLLTKISNFPGIHSLLTTVTANDCLMHIEIDSFDITNITTQDIGMIEEILNSEGLMLQSSHISSDKKNALLTINFS